MVIFLNDSCHIKYMQVTKFKIERKTMKCAKTRTVLHIDRPFCFVFALVVWKVLQSLL